MPGFMSRLRAQWPLPSRLNRLQKGRKMAELLTSKQLPKWLRKAVRKGALTWPEAQAIWFNNLMAPPDLEWVPLPPALCEAGRKLSLLEQPEAGGMQ